MTYPTNDTAIGNLLNMLRRDGFQSYYAAFSALLEERNALQEENIALRSRQKSHQDEVLDRMFEMDALRKRVAELEANPPAGNLRERLVESALRGAGTGAARSVRSSMLTEAEAEALGRQAVWMADGAFDEMRKEEANGK